MLKPFAVTSGEPAGIGPDLTLSIAQRDDASEFVVFGDLLMLEERANALKLGIDFVQYDRKKNYSSLPKQSLLVKHFDTANKVLPGKLDQQNSSYVIAMIENATQECLNKDFQGMITGPVHKNIINQSGINFSGHTEFIANICKSNSVMAFVSDNMKMALATTHIALKEVPEAIDSSCLIETIEIIEKDLQVFFGLKKPTIGVLGLNPHAGEQGLLGKEELLIIEPTLEYLRKKNKNIVGPISADTAFLQNLNLDIILALYHDQGLPLFKYVNPYQAANVTLGLPIIRTSVDHGIALDLTASNNVNNESLHYALMTAKKMSQSYAEKN